MQHTAVVGRLSPQMGNRQPDAPPIASTFKISPLQKRICALACDEYSAASKRFNRIFAEDETSDSLIGSELQVGVTHVPKALEFVIPTHCTQSTTLPAVMRRVSGKWPSGESRLTPAPQVCSEVIHFGKPATPDFYCQSDLTLDGCAPKISFHQPGTFWRASDKYS